MIEDASNSQLQETEYMPGILCLKSLSQSCPLRHEYVLVQPEFLSPRGPQL